MLIQNHIEPYGKLPLESAEKICQVIVYISFKYLK